MIKYRNDIDGLRAFAVCAVIIFHLGFLPNGYLGVDIFFVISGYLITSIIFQEIIHNKFSILKFYERRIRRIIPLLLFVTTTTFVLGIFFMLPNDLENLAQSVVASNFSVNNILMLITSSNYWATENDYKPLMHTWSLGIEEQFYLLYPFLLLVISKFRQGYIKPLLFFTTLLSLSLFIFFGNPATRFFLLQFRFFELSIGGLAAIMFFKVDDLNKRTRYIYYFSIFFLFLVIFIPYGNNSTKIVSTAILTTLVLTMGKYFHQSDKFSKYLLQNKIVIFIGKISFSLYMWHHVVFAFSRYTFFGKLDIISSIILFFITLFLSIFSYYFIENVFRNKKILSSRLLYTILGLTFLVSTTSSLYVYMIGGIIRDYPSLDLYERDNHIRGYNFFSSANNIHINYNESVRNLDRNFEKSDKKNVLVVGNSYGRDVVNIFKESSLSSKVNLSYYDMNRINFDEEIKSRWLNADYVVLAAPKDFISKRQIKEIGHLFKFEIDTEKIVVFGTKDYGQSNGIHYNKLNSISDFNKYYTRMKDGVWQIEAKLKKEWGGQYISLLDPISDKSGKVRVFTADGKFISQDAVHLTKQGATFYAKILEKRLEKFFD